MRVFWNPAPSGTANGPLFSAGSAWVVCPCRADHCFVRAPEYDRLHDDRLPRRNRVKQRCEKALVRGFNCAFGAWDDQRLRALLEQLQEGIVIANERL